MSSMLYTNLPADPFNPAWYYLNNRASNFTWYSEYYYQNYFFNSLRMPIPAFWNAFNASYNRYDLYGSINADGVL